MNNKKGLKINNDNSSILKPKPNIKEEFDKIATEAHSRNQDYIQRASTFGLQFKELLLSTKLDQNKTELDKNRELEIITELRNLVSDLNSDEDQPEGQGSSVITFLLLKMMLLQHDQINNLAFTVEKLEKQISKNAK